MKKEKSKRLYPVTFNGKNYYEKDCDDLFTAFYNDPLDLMDDGSVYASDGVYVFPDGSSPEDY